MAEPGAGPSPAGTGDRGERRAQLLERLSKLEGAVADERYRTERAIRRLERVQEAGDGDPRTSRQSQRSRRPETQSSAGSRITEDVRSAPSSKRGEGGPRGPFFGRKLSDVTRLERDLRLTSVRPTALFASVAREGGKVNMQRRRTDVTEHQERRMANSASPADPDHDLRSYRRVRDALTQDEEVITWSLRNRGKGRG